MDSNLGHNGLASAAPGVDDAVGVPARRWYIAIVNNRSEKAVAEKLTQRGVESYAAVQSELRQWRNGRRATVKRVVIPSIVFIRCTERERRELCTLPYINRFMTNKASEPGSCGHKPLATVPEPEMRRLQFMLGVSDPTVAFEGRYVKGDPVKVIRGPFKSLTGEILQDADGRSNRLYIRIAFLGSASVSISPLDVEPLNA